MCTIRVNKNKNYTVMSNYHLRDKNLSLKAKGLLSLMLSLPEDWDYSVKGLATLSKDGKDSITTTLKELEQYGYLKRTRVVNELNRFKGYDYDIFEYPITEKPFTENPDTGKPDTAIINTNSICNTNSSIITNSLYISNKINTKEINTNINKKESVIKEKKHEYGEYKNVLLSDNEYNNLVNEFGKSIVDEKITKLDEYLEANDNKNGYKRFGVVLKRAIKENWFNTRKDLKPRNRVDNPNISSEWLDQEIRDIFDKVNAEF